MENDNYNQPDGGVPYWQNPENPGPNGPSGFNGPNGPNGPAAPQTPPYMRNQMAVAALSCGAASLLMLCFGGSPILGALGIILSLLSRTDKMESIAKVGLGLSIGGISLFGISLAVTISVIVSTGTFDKILKEGAATDWSDQYSVQQFGYDIQDDVTEMYDSLLQNALKGTGLTGSLPSALTGTGT